MYFIFITILITLGNIKGGWRDSEAGLQRRPDRETGWFHRRPDGQKDDPAVREQPEISKVLL